MAYNADAAFLPSWGSGMKPPLTAGQDSPASTSNDLKAPLKPSKTATKTVQSGTLQSATVPQKQGSIYGAGYGSAGSIGTMQKPRQIWVMADGTLTCGMIVLPFLAFFIIALTFLKYWRHAWLAHLAIVFMVASSMLCIYIGGVKARGCYEDNKVTDQFLVFLGCFCFVLALLGVTIGFVGFYTYTMPYNIAVNSRYYENVMPSENPGAKRDASMVQFAPGGHVESTKGLGYKEGSLYCVAPVFGLNTGNYVGYWAAGVDCCDSRGSFRCNDVHDTSVRGGLVVEPLKEYMDAAAQAAAQYDLTIPEQPVFIQWISDVNKAVSNIASAGHSFIWNSILIVFLVCLVVGLLINFIHGKKQNGFVDRLYSIGPNEEGSHKPDPYKLDPEESMLQPMALAEAGKMQSAENDKTQSWAFAEDGQMNAEDDNTQITTPAEAGPDEVKEEPDTTQVTYDPEALLPQGNINLKQDPFMTTH